MYKVAVIEDEEIIRKTIILTIPWKDMDCVIVGEASNGEDGAGLILTKNPDIVVMDINMPVKDGLTMLEETYEQGHYTAIILSGYSDFEYARKAFHYGVKGYLLKPINVEEFVNTVQYAKKECDIRREWLEKQVSKDNLKSMSVMKDVVEQKLDDEVVKRMLEYVYENYQKKIVFQELVDTLNYSDTFLNKRFKDAVHTTFTDYLNRYRVQKSIEQMLGGKTSVQDIAISCGIPDYKYFSVVFRKFVGCSPKEYLNSIHR